MEPIERRGRARGRERGVGRGGGGEIKGGEIKGGVCNFDLNIDTVNGEFEVKEEPIN